MIKIKIFLLAILAGILIGLFGLWQDFSWVELCIFLFFTGTIFMIGMIIAFIRIKDIINGRNY